MYREINDILRPYFANIGLNLVDFKLEFRFGYLFDVRTGFEYLFKNNDPERT